MATDKTSKPKKYGTNDIPSLLGKRVRFKSGREGTTYEAKVVEGRDGYRLKTRDDAGVERSIFPAACTVIG